MGIKSVTFTRHAAAPKHRIGEMSVTIFERANGEPQRAIRVVNGCVAALPWRCQLRCRCVVASVVICCAVCG